MKFVRLVRIIAALVLVSASYGQTQGTGDKRLLSPDDMTGVMGCNSANAGASASCGTIEATTRLGLDIGAKINSAYEALPSTGGVITVAASAGCYNFSTPISLNTAGKYAVLQGLAPSNQNGSGSCLNYVPISATTAITIDWTPRIGGGWVPGAGLRDISLINNGCVTPGGCGSLATGIAIGTVNGGAEFGYFENIAVSGFGVGIKMHPTDGGPGSASFGMSWVNHSARYNTVGWSFPPNSFVENLHFIGGTISQNGTGFQEDAGSEVDFLGTSFDSNTVAGLTCSGGGYFTFISPRFENNGGTTTHFITCANGVGNVSIHGGFALDDVTSGSIDYWFSTQTVSVDGLAVFSSGRTVKNLFTVAQQSNIKLIDNSPTALPLNSLGVLGAVNGSYEVTSANNALLKPIYGTEVYDFRETTSPPAVAGGDRCYGDASVHAIKCSYDAANFQQIPVSTQGTCTAGMNCVIRFAAPFYKIPICVATDQTGPNPVKATPSNTGVTFSGTEKDRLAWVCIGNPN